MNKIFFISDTHFGDTEIIKYENWPFEDPNSYIKEFTKKWNNTVDKNDVVYHLGDVAENMDETCLKNIICQLNGHKYLVLGNHDKAYDAKYFYNVGFEKIYDLPVILDGFYILSHEPLYMTTNIPYVNIFGHVHGNPMYKTVSSVGYCVCLEKNDFSLTPYEKIKKEIIAERIKYI